MGGGRELQAGTGRDLDEGDRAGVAGLPDIRGAVEAVLEDGCSGAMAREQGKAVVALLQSPVAVSLGVEDSLATSEDGARAVGEAGAWSPGVGAFAVAEGGAGVVEGVEGVGINLGAARPRVPALEVASQPVVRRFGHTYGR